MLQQGLLCQNYQPEIHKLHKTTAHNLPNSPEDENMKQQTFMHPIKMED